MLRVAEEERAPSPDKVVEQREHQARILAVRKNRMGLMVRIRETVGPESWEKLQAEMPGPDRMMMMGPPGGGMRREIRVIRSGDGNETVDVQE